MIAVDTATSSKAFKMLIRDAVTRHPSYGAALANFRAVQVQIQGARAARRPQVGLRLSNRSTLNRRFDEIDNIDRSQPKYRTDAHLTISQLLYDFGQSASEIGRQKFLALAQLARARSQVSALVLDTLNACINTAIFQTLEQVLVDSNASHREIVSRIQLRVNRGAASARELSQAQARVAESLARLTLGREQLAASVAAFREYFPDAELCNSLPHGVTGLPETPEQARALAVMNNPELKAALAEIKAADQEVQKQYAAIFPAIRLELRGSQYDLLGAGDDYDTYTSLAMDLELYSGGRGKAERRRAIEERDRLRLSHDATLRAFSRQIGSLLALLRQSNTKLAAFKAAYRANYSNRNFLKSQFLSGRAGLLDLLQAERDLAEAADSYLSTMRDTEFTKYRLLLLTGQLDQHFDLELPEDETP